MSLDFANYYNTGSRVLHGEARNIYDPHSLIAGEPHKIKTYTTVDYAGFPLSAVLFAPLGFFEPQTGILVFKLFCALCLLAGLIFLYRHFADVRAAAANPDGDLVAYLFILLMFEPIWKIFEVGGQATALTFLLLVVFLNFYVRDAKPWGALALSLAILIKPPLALVGFVLLVAGEWQFLFWLGGILSAEGLLSVALFGFGLHLQWLDVVRVKSNYWIQAWPFNASPLSFPSNVMRLARHYTSIERPISVTLTFVAYRLVLAAFAAYLTRQFVHAAASPVARRRAYALLGIALAISYPGIVWEHYLTFLLPALIYLVWRRGSLPVYARWLAFAALLFTVRAHKMFSQDVNVLLEGDQHLIRLALLCLYGGGTLLLLIPLWPLFLDKSPQTAPPQAPITAN